jgi:hypothetical protein
MHTFLTPVLAASFLAGCAALPPSPQGPTNPASARAPEGSRIGTFPSLRDDEATRKTQSLLSAARKEQEHWDAFGPVSGSPESAAAPEERPHKNHGHP